ncbi:hypothetical protein RYH80_02820 [Halobaculum sp. MBLA0147]|uniref:hypothetical protein n=1 Tax=Halobaculum sp. MBLA0147 TaxID=3079934 RepID=UPI00352368E0
MRLSHTGRVVVVVVILVVTAGCAGVLGGEGGDGDAETVNPALQGTPTPTATPSPTPTPSFAETLPSGISRDAVDPEALADRHRRVLRRTSRTVVRITTVTGPNGTVVGRTRTTIAAASDRAGDVLLEGSGGGTDPVAFGLPTGEYGFWTDGTAAASRRTLPNGTVRYSYRSGTLPPGPRADTTGVNLVASATRRVSDVTVTPVETGSDGRTASLLRLRGRVADPPSEAVENASLVASVTGEGVVQTLRVRYTLVRDGRRYRVVRELVVSDLGQTVVSRPAWVADAQAAERDEGAETATPTATATTTATPSGTATGTGNATTTATDG